MPTACDDYHSAEEVLVKSWQSMRDYYGGISLRDYAKMAAKCRGISPVPDAAREWLQDNPVEENT